MSPEHSNRYFEPTGVQLPCNSGLLCPAREAEEHESEIRRHDWCQWRTEGGGLGCSNPPSPPRNSEVLTKSNRIAN
jgi:hypothetical protein